MTEQNKKCTHCQKEIDIKAIRCPHCQADLRKWNARHPILTFILFFIGVIIVSNLASTDTPVQSQIKVAENSLTQNSPNIKQISTVPADYLGKTFTLSVNVKADNYYNYGFDDDSRYYSVKIWDSSSHEYDGVYAYMIKNAQNKSLFESIINSPKIVRMQVYIPKEKYTTNSNAFMQINTWEQLN